MPRPRNALGRPDTPVVPANWEAGHAPVASKTFTAECRVNAGDANTAEPVWDPAVKSPVRPPAPVLYEGGCRVQVMNQRTAIKLLGDQAARHMTYLVSIERGAEIPSGAVIEMTASSDSLLEPGHQLTVADVMRGTLTFQRDLVCVDDLTPSTDEE